MHPTNPKRLLVLLGLLLLPVGLLQALSSDRQQPIAISADRVSIDEKRGISTYTGAVVMRQGSLQLTAERVVVHRQGNELRLLEAEGSPAHFRQRIDGEAEEVQGTARQIDYRAGQRSVQLRGGAVLQQGADRFSGELIDYDLDREHITAGGGDQGRVEVIFQPKSEKPAAPGSDSGKAPAESEESQP